MTFQEFQLDPTLLRAVEDLGFERPMPIQERAIPEVLAGRDVLGRAQTGTGKTAAFGLPILQRLLVRDDAKARHRRPRCLVLAPTRELALQVHRHLEALAKHTELRGIAIIGGESDMPAQEHRLRTGTDWVVATPGRLLAHLSRDYVDFDAIEFFVLDEADRLLELGFLPDIQRIAGDLPPRRQTLLFSATLPPAMRQLARALLNDPVRIDVGEVTTPEPLREEVLPVPRTRKDALLLHLLSERTIGSAMIFVRTKRRAAQLTRTLCQAGHEARELHADRSMPERRAALEEFERGSVPLLVATDLAARGLDIFGLTHVINYDVPNVAEEYIHRAGRTGRAGRGGEVLTLMAPEEEVLVARIEQVVRKRLPETKFPGFAPDGDGEARGPAEQPRKQRVGDFTARKPSKKKKESPFTRSGKVRPGFEIPDHEAEQSKKRKKRSKLRKRLPHQK